MSFNRKSEVLVAEAIAMIAEGLTMGLFYACAFVWLALYATQAAP